jgi:hypothetical protein
MAQQKKQSVLPDKPQIRAIYDPSDEEKEVIGFVYHRRDQMEESPDRQRVMQGLDQWEKQYEGWRAPRKPDDWQSNHVVPLTNSVVQTAVSEIVKQNLRPFVMPRGFEDKGKTRLMQFIYDYAWEVADGDMFIYDAVVELLVNGTVIAYEYYRVDKRRIGNIKINKDGKEEVEYEEVVDYDDVYTEIVKLQDFYVDEFARGFSGSYKARDCIRRYVMDIDDFHAMYDDSVWDQFGNAKLVKAGGDVNYYEFFKPPQGIDTSRQVEVLHYWNEPKDKFIIVANEVLIRDNPNPYRHKRLPYARGVDIKRPHSFYGKGEPELLESIQDEVNILRRMIIDRNHLDIDKMFLVSNKLGLSDEDLIARPHGMIPTDDITAAKPVEYGDIPRSVELSLKHLEDDATITTGINPRAQALPTAGTATEAAILKESTLRRLETKIFLLKKELLVRLGRLRLSNILQFYAQPKLEKIVGEKNSDAYKNQVANLENQSALVTLEGENFQKTYRKIRIDKSTIEFDERGRMKEVPVSDYSFFEIKPDFFMPVERGGYDLKFQAGANIELSKPLMQTKILELYDRLLQVALQIPGSYDPVKLGDMVVSEYFDKDPDEYKPDQPGQDEAGARMQMMIQLASYENQMMMKGQAIPATQYASPAHTRIHIEFMNSEEFQALPNESPLIRAFTEHVMGEIIAQEARSINGVGAAPIDGGQPVEEEAPAHGGTQRTRVSQGVENRPGGMKKPANKIGDIMPALNTGGNRNLP